MLRYSVIRVLWMIPILLCVSFIVYALIDAAPGTIVDLKITDDMSQEAIDALYASYDLDKPMLWRYGKYMINLAQGSLGNSLVSNEPILETYLSRMWASVSLSFSGLILGILIAIPLGIFAAKHSGTILDNLTTAFTLIGLSMPGFWLGLMLLILFAHHLKIFPAVYDGTWKCYVLPVVANGLSMSAGICRQTRSAILDVSRQDYLRTARAKGVPERRIMVKHELRNAWIPVITQIGALVAISLAGNAVIETVYSWPGTGRLLVNAITQRDSTMACGCVILTSTLYSIILLIVDLIYAFVDPRIKAAYTSKGKKKKKGAAKA